MLLHSVRLAVQTLADKLCAVHVRLAVTRTFPVGTILKSRIPGVASYDKTCAAEQARNIMRV